MGKPRGRPRIQDNFRLGSEGLAKVLGDLEARVMRAVWDLGDASPARAVYERVGSSVATATEQTDVGYWFAGAGAVLLLAGAGLSAVWFNRIP